MAYGTGHDTGVMAPADVAGAGELEWYKHVGVPPTHPLVGGPDHPDLGAFDVDRGRSRVVTTPEGNVGPAPGVMVIDGWRDLLNFKGSPAPWVLLGALAILGFMQFRVQARVGRAKASAALG
jgi:hypothetical protein